MFQFIDPASDLTGALLRVLVAAIVGGLIGVERERSQSQQHEAAFAGARTFPLIAILGASLTLVSGGVGAAVIAGFLGLAALVVASYFLTARGTDPGMTTEVAAFAVFWIGVMAGAGAVVLAGAIGVGTAVLLASKERLDAFSRALTREELSATLTLAVLAAVVLPALPDVEVGPWGVWNPRKLWLVVVLVCGLSFIAFIAARIWGAARGLYLSGALGGLASSTAVTVTFATRSRETPAHAIPLAVAAGLASLIMVLRVAILATVADRSVGIALAPFLGVVAMAGAVPILIFARRTPPEGKALDLSNPFQLKTALKFTLMFAVVLLVVELAKRAFGSWGLMVAAVLAGLTDVDAITLALASSSLPPDQAAAAIALAALSNTAAKAGYAVWFGEARFRRTALLILGTAFAAGIAAMVLVGPRPWAT